MEKKYLFGVFVLAIVLSIVLLGFPGVFAASPANITLNLPLDGANISGTYVLTANLTSSTEVHNVSFYYQQSSNNTWWLINWTLNSSSNQTDWTHSWATSGLADCSNLSISAVAFANATTQIDVHNNTGLTLDNTAPVVTIHTSYTNASDKKNTDSLTLNVSVNDATVGITDGTNCIFDINGTNETVAISKTSTTFGWCNSTHFNLTGLADGNAQIKVYISDSIGNTQLNDTRYVQIDTTNPSVLVSCNPSSAVEGSTIKCECSGTDATSGVSTTTDDSTITALTEGIFTYTCTITDAAGNSASEDVTYTITDAGGQTPSSSGPVAGAAVSQEIHSWTTIDPGEIKVMSGFDEEVGVEDIQIEVETEATGVRITVKKYDDKPANVAVAKSGTVNQYIQIDADNLEDKLEKATVRFRVEKTWATQNSLTQDDIGVFKFNETAESWSEITSTYVEDDATYYYYDVELDSFSYFAISAIAVTTEDGEPAEPGEEETTLLWLWILLGLIVLIAIGWGIAKTKKQPTQ